MIQKYFPLDKNYILEQAQLDQEERLIVYLIDFAKKFYLDQFNPLGLEDDTVKQIKAHNTEYTDRLVEFYRNLAGVYRYKHGNNQLEFLFDGKDHYDKYTVDWVATYEEWLVDFCLRPNFLKAVLELTVFYPEGRKAELAESRMKAFIHQHFELKIYKYKGIVKMKIA
ncbi:hypothetical protein GCM10009122_21400 [Fulvivirga kasyanovii]|uniref:Uncharacterized protein n=1 Tax=Fulvivirga kasyanovii TaxID=396812 RepID=A0ABW9RYI9_9BACT|nr:hypothetical protein [Fulvivirga kasyanovii]MTI28125.1 hypothetical protein [Fulvivirga kasyanovii]